MAGCSGYDILDSFFCTAIKYVMDFSFSSITRGWKASRIPKDGEGLYISGSSSRLAQTGGNLYLNRLVTL